MLAHYMRFFHLLQRSASDAIYTVVKGLIKCNWKSPNQNLLFFCYFFSAFVWKIRRWKLLPRFESRKWRKSKTSNSFPKQRDFFHFFSTTFSLLLRFVRVCVIHCVSRAEKIESNRLFTLLLSPVWSQLNRRKPNAAESKMVIFDVMFLSIRVSFFLDLFCS